MAQTGEIKAKDGITLVYEKHGKNGPSIVLLHGWSGSKAYFCRNVASLSEKFQVIKQLTEYPQ
jgi:pimeloyl-ACP methyl ester carboxylesterase